MVPLELMYLFLEGADPVDGVGVEEQWELPPLARPRAVAHRESVRAPTLHAKELRSDTDTAQQAGWLPLLTPAVHLTNK
ncbi:Protein of unknown function [Gryllus bimaculatus]|nr:Protein of unknown function [Gryllus bimaculatus]